MFFEPFIIKAIIAGIGIAAFTGALGCFIVWKRMAYFGDSLAHSSLLGIALGIAVSISMNISIIFISLCFALLLLCLQKKEFLPSDSILGILTHAALSFGIISLSLTESQNLDIHSFLFGDILTVNTQDIYWIYAVAVIIIGIIVLNFKTLVLTTINEDLAKADKINTERQKLLIIFLTTLAVSASIKIVGALLITAMLIVPASCARFISRSPKSMAINSSIIAMISVIGGFAFSINFDVPTGAAIVASSVCLFAIALVFRRK